MLSAGEASDQQQTHEQRGAFSLPGQGLLLFRADFGVPCVAGF